jgi:CSLREA domain-containing protein
MTALRTSLRGLSVAVCLIAATPAVAAVFAVTRFDDPQPDGCQPADCSLREAVIAANQDSAPDDVVLGSGIYELSLLYTPGATPEQYLDLEVTAPLRIFGSGSEFTIIRNTHIVPTSPIPDARIFYAINTDLDITGVTLRDGRAHYVPSVARGGCLRAEGGTLSLSDVRITGCAGDIGGGMQLTNMSADFDHVQVDQNSSFVGAGLALNGDVILTGRHVLPPR